MNTLKAPPQNTDAEMSVLGAILVNNDAMDEATEMLKPEHFYRAANRTIYEAMIALSERGDPIDLVSLKEALGARLDGVGGVSYLMLLAEQVPSAARIGYYSEIVHEKFCKRLVGEAGNKIIALAYQDDEQEPAALFANAQAILLEATESKTQKGLVDRKTIIQQMYDEIEQAANGESEGVSTGFPNLDCMIGGLQPGELTILAARPAMGKTACMMAIAEYISRTAPVAVFSLEMNSVTLMKRLAASLSGVDSMKLRSGKLTTEEWQRLNAASDRLYKRQLMIDDTPALTPAEVRAKCQRMKAKHGLALVVVDYLQRMELGKRAENRNLEVGGIVRQMKSLARQLNVPVLLLSQLSRDVEKRGDKRPVLSDLRESGDVEQEADQVLMLYRENYYSRESETGEPETMEILVEKNRHGATGTTRISFEPRYSRFRSIAS